MRRTVFLVDMNAFFISCEQSRNPELLGKPAAVAGDPKKRSGIILAANYDARKYGVYTTMVLHEAKRLCPNLILIPPDHRFYEERSKEVMTLLGTYTPIVQQNSIDEAWLDMTGTEKLFGSPREAAEKIMSQIKNELGLFCSIGIAENKFLSKMASEMKKPQGITELWQSDLPEKLWPLPVNAMYGVGKSTAEKLKKEGILMIGDLAKAKRSLLVSLLGVTGEHLLALANGIDPDPVSVNKENAMKSIGRSTTLSEDTVSLEKAKLVLMELCEDVGASARRHEKAGRTVQITIKYADFRTITRQMSIPETNLTKEILRAGYELLEKNWDPRKPVRLLGISLTGFEEEGSPQLSFFDNIAPPIRDEREARLENAMDAIRSKHGSNVLQRAALIQKKS